MTADEVGDWFHGSSKQLAMPLPDMQALPDGAKSPTRPPRPKYKFFGTMGGDDGHGSAALKPVPQKLPRKTRIQMLNSGAAGSGSDVSDPQDKTQLPASSRESDLNETQGQ